MTDNILGRGTYGEVREVGGHAIKKFAHRSCLIQEYVVLKYLRDCNYIVRTTGVNFPELELSMELYDCNMKSWLRNYRENIDVAMNLLRDVLCGLIELHDRDLIHGDLKPGNVLIRLHPLSAVLGDCGFVSISKYARSDKTTPNYCDPVIHHDSHHDIYSFGIMLLEVVSQKRINGTATNYAEIRNLVLDALSDSKHRTLVLRCLAAERQTRPTARELLHELFNETRPRWMKPQRYSASRPENVQGQIFEISERQTMSERNYPLRVVGHSRAHNKVLRNILWEADNKYRIRRAKKGYGALIRYVNNHNIKECDYQLYCRVTLLILSSVFGSGDPDRDIPRYSLRQAAEGFGSTKIYNTLKEMVRDQDFVNLLMYPQKR